MAVAKPIDIRMKSCALPGSTLAYSERITTNFHKSGLLVNDAKPVSHPAPLGIQSNVS